MIFKNPCYSAIPYLEVLYRPLYPNIVYCGPGYPDVEETPELKPFQYNFVSYGSTPTGHPRQGALTYECVNLSLSFDLPVEGYLMIQDDILLAPHQLERLRPSMTWFFPPTDWTYNIIDFEHMTKCKRGNCNIPITDKSVNTWMHYRDQVCHQSDLACTDVSA